jgi:energy-converting hydrogenase B subunit L
VGEVDFDAGRVLQKPVKISEDKLRFISQFLADKSVMKSTTLAEAARRIR